MPKTQFLPSSHSIFSYPLAETEIYCRRTAFVSKRPVLKSSLSFSHQSQIQRPIICAWKKKRRYGSRRSRKIVLELMSTLASNLKILPQPLNLVLAEFAGLDGEELGFWKGFGGWRRRGRKRNLGFWMFLGICGLCLLFGREVKIEAFLGILGFGLAGAACIRGWKRGLKNWVFGFCCCGILLTLGLRGENSMKWVKETRVLSPVVELVRIGKRAGIPAFSEKRL